MVKKVYRVENLDCANCASKVEAALNALPEVQEAVLTYATMQLRITAEDPDALLPKLQEAAQKVEPEVEFYPRDGAHTHHSNTGEHEHHHDCCCGHEHHHDHDHEHEHCHDHAHDHHHDDDHEHEHEHHHNHEHTHEHGGEESKDLKPILVGAVLFVVGLVLDHFGLKWPTLGVCLVAYVLLGREVIVTAVKNLARGQMLDENFLMALASIGAFFTGSFTEAGAEMRSNSKRLADTLRSFGVDARPGEVVRGPSVTRYEFAQPQGVKLSKITNLSDDIALALGVGSVRVAPVPGKISAVGIEVPNRAVTPVRIREVIESREFTGHKSAVAFAVGKDIGGNRIIGDIAKLPHVLIAGTTGSGKSVCTNSLIVSMLYKSTPEEVRFIMVDPKMVELAPYNGIPHLLIPVVTDPKKAAGALQWAVFEMMKRYKLFSEHGVKDLAGYNALARQDEELKTMPTVVVVIDELADLMLVAAKEVEESICRVAQMGRAAGMHLVIATQRPSSDVITGLMKANIPSRIAFAVASSLESRIILDTTGAEKLVGKGDMLYAPLGAGKPTRVQGCFITPEEIERVVGFVKTTGEAEYSREVMDKIEQAVKEKEKGGGGKTSAEPAEAQEDGDELLPAAVEVVLETGQASVSMLQRRLKLGYSRAARLVDQMEERGIVGPFEGSKPRQLLIDKAKWQELQMSKQPQPEPEIDRSGSIRDVFESRDALE